MSYPVETDEHGDATPPCQLAKDEADGNVALAYLDEDDKKGKADMSEEAKPSVPNCHNCGKPLKTIEEKPAHPLWEWDEDKQKYDTDCPPDASDYVCGECGAVLNDEEYEFFYNHQ